MEKEKFGYMMASPDIYEILKANARENRRNMTEAESMMWECLKCYKKSHHFRRQHMIGDYIVDFVCLTNRLVIEVDGEYHFTDEQQKLDTMRTEYLNSKGFHVMRFTNQQVMNETNAVKASIEEYLFEED